MILQVQRPSSYNPLPLHLEILGIDYNQEPISRPIGLPYFQWFYCVNGKGEFIVNNQRSIITQNQGLLIYPQIPHSYHPLTSDWTVHFFGVSGLLCREILAALQMLETGVYHFSKPDVFIDHMQELYRLYRKDIPEKTVVYSKACYDFLLDLSPCITRMNPSSYVKTNEVTSSLIQYMEDHYNRDIPLDELAEVAGLSKEYMCTMFKKNMRQTIIHYLTTIRLIHARIFLIRFPHKTVAEIGRMCGFQNPSYFGKTFKLETGVTPEAFRKNSIGI